MISDLHNLNGIFKDCGRNDHNPDVEDKLGAQIFCISPPFTLTVSWGMK